MRMWGTRSQRLASLLAVTVIALALPGCGSSSNDSGGGTNPVTALFETTDTSTAGDLVRFSAATCTNDLCTLEISIGATTASNYYAFAFDILVSNPAIAQFVPGSDFTGNFLTGTVDSIASQPSDRVVVGVTKVGGISEEYRIAQYADDHSILFVPHGWNTAVGLAADLQLVSAAANARWVEYITPAPYIEELLLNPIVLNSDGMSSIPDGPGLGLDWNPDGIAKFTGGLSLTSSAI